MKPLKDSPEDRIIFEIKSQSHYVYQMGVGHYQVRENKLTHAVIIWDLNNPDEDEDTKQRAIEYCEQFN
jgi:hypothetical protein